MDRRSWLWRRKSSEKSPGETESSGSLSSHSERFSDDQAYSNHNSQSPEVMSKVESGDEELNDRVKTLTEKLSAALVNISAKEDLVQQHAKVAEEAVSGWERAEDEVLTLKQQLEATTQKNSALEDRVSHLDGALKECLRQLRQAREEQEQKIHEVVAKRTRELECTKSQLETQVIELQTQLETVGNEAAVSIEPDLRPKLEAADKEVNDLKLKLLSQAEELKRRSIERDLSTQAAETASKHHLESIKKVTKLEAECRRLKSVLRKVCPVNDHKSCTASSTYVESFTDSQSDCGERLLTIETDICKMSGLEPNECEPGRSDSWASALISELDQFKNEKALGRNYMVPAVEMNLMDDFLEMEKLAALPGTHSGNNCLAFEGASSQPSGGETALKAELESMMLRTSELEENLEKMGTDKVNLEMALSKCQEQLQTSQDSLQEAELQLGELRSQLAQANEMKNALEGDLAVTNSKRETAESQLSVFESEINTLLSKVSSLEEEIKKEKILSAENANKCQKLENEVSGMKLEAECQHSAVANGELKIKQEKELAVAASKLAECQQTIASLGRQLKSLATLEDFMSDLEKPLDSFNEKSLHTKDGREPWKLYSGDSYSIKLDMETQNTTDISSATKSDRNLDLSVSQASSMAGKSRNGFGKLFHKSKGGNYNDDRRK